MPYLPFGIRNRVSLPDSVRKDGTQAFGNNGFPGKYFNEVAFKLMQDHVLGTEAQVKTYGLADIWYNGTVFKDKDDVTVTLFDYDRINIVIDSMERDIVFPAVQLNFSAHSKVNMNGYDITIQDIVTGRIEIINDISDASFDEIATLNITGRSDALKIPKSSKINFLDDDDQGGINRGVWSDGTYLYVAASTTGLHAYSFDGTTLLHKDTHYQSGSYYKVWGDGTYIYVAGDTGGIHAYTFNGTTLTPIASDYSGGGNYRGVWGDGTYIYIANENPSVGLLAYTFDGATFSLKDTHYESGTGNYRDVFGDGTFIYIAGATGGLSSFSFNGTTLSYIDTDDQGGSYDDVWSDGNYLYVAAYTAGILSYSVDISGNLTFIEANTSGGNDSVEIHGDGTYVYVAGGTNGLEIYAIDTGGHLIFIDFDDLGTYLGVHYNSNYIYLGCSSDGIKVYDFDINDVFKLNFTGTGSIFEAGTLITP